MGESYDRPSKTSDYTIVNIEKGNQLDSGASVAKHDEFIKQGKTVFMVSNNCERNYHHMHPKSLLITSAKHLYTTFANANHVVTTRAHTTICCLTEGVKVDYRGILDYRTRGLMATVGVDLTKLETYDPMEVKVSVEASKKEFIDLVRSKVKLG